MTQVKPLEWKQDATDSSCLRCWFAAHPYGGYHIYERDTSGKGRIRYFTTPVNALTEFFTLEGAMIAVSADYEARIRSALVAPAVPGEVGMVAMVDAAMAEMANISPPLRRSECERLIKAALSAPLPEIEGGDKGDGWQPIETAPKDGSDFLGSAVGCGQHIAYWAHWRDNITNTDEQGFRDTHELGRLPWLTHWQPLPAAPEGEKK